MNKVHCRTIPFLVSGTGPDGNKNYLITYDGGYHSVDDYLARSDMAENGVWGGDFEMYILAYMLDISRLTIVSREAKKKQAVRDEQVCYLQVAPL